MSPTGTAGSAATARRAPARTGRRTPRTVARRTGRWRKSNAPRHAGRCAASSNSSARVSCRSNFATAGVRGRGPRRSGPAARARAARCSGTRAPPGTAASARCDRAGSSTSTSRSNGTSACAERRQVGRRGRPVEQLGERRGRVDRGAQHQGVDEHADQVVERRLAATGDRGADRDVVGAAQPGQQHRERGVHHHEQRRVACRGAVATSRAVQLRRRRANSTAPPRQRLLRRPRPVGRQLQHVRQRRPARRASSRAAARVSDVRVVLGAEHLAAATARSRRTAPAAAPTRGRPGGARRVGRHHVAGQRRHREAVGADVVHHEDQHVLVGADPRTGAPAAGLRA